MKILLSKIFMKLQHQLTKMLKQFGNFYDSERKIFLYTHFQDLLHLGLIYSNKDIVSFILDSIKSPTNYYMKLTIEGLLTTSTQVFERINESCRENSLNSLIDLSNNDSSLIKFNYMGVKVTPMEIFFHLTNSNLSQISSNAHYLFKDGEASNALKILEMVTDLLSCQLQKLFLFFDESRIRTVLVRLLDLSPPTVNRLSISLFTKISLLMSTYLRFYFCRESQLNENKDLEINFLLEKFYNFQMNYFSSRRMNFRDGMSLMVFQESDKILQTLSSLYEVFDNISHLALLDNKNKKTRLRKNFEKIYKTMKVKDDTKHPIGIEYLKSKREFISIDKAPPGYGEFLNIKASKFNLVQHKAFTSRAIFDFYSKYWISLTSRRWSHVVFKEMSFVLPL